MRMLAPNEASILTGINSRYDIITQQVLVLHF